MDSLLRAFFLLLRQTDLLGVLLAAVTTAGTAIPFLRTISLLSQARKTHADAVFSLNAAADVSSAKPNASYKSISPETTHGPSTTLTRERIQLREQEVRSALRKQQWDATLYSWSTGLLTFAQYVVGAILTSSFVTASMSSKWIGFLGLVVLVSSTVKQQFKPEAIAQAARKKVLNYRAVIRTTDDQLALIDLRQATGEKQSEQLIAVLNNLTTCLNKIEGAELPDLS